MEFLTQCRRVLAFQVRVRALGQARLDCGLQDNIWCDPKTKTRRGKNELSPYAAISPTRFQGVEDVPYKPPHDRRAPSKVGRNLRRAGRSSAPCSLLDEGVMHPAHCFSGDVALYDGDEELSFGLFSSGCIWHERDQEQESNVYVRTRDECRGGSYVDAAGGARHRGAVVSIHPALHESAPLSSFRPSEARNVEVGSVEDLQSTRRNPEDEDEVARRLAQLDLVPGDGTLVVP